MISLRCDNINIKLNVQDTAGQERFKSISSKYYRSAHGFFFVYDIGNLDSFKNIKNWIDNTKEFNDKEVVNFLVGNKSDSEDRKVTFEQGLEFAKENNLGFFETSAKENKNVDEAFSYITQKLLTFYSKNSSIYNQLTTGDMYKNQIGQKGEEIEIKCKPRKKECCK